MSTYNQPDGRRGDGKSPGWWISFEEAQQISCAKEKWWEFGDANGRRVEAKQSVRDAPQDKPVWLFDCGDMYIGQWKEKGPKGHPVEHGFGITYNVNPYKCKGLIYIGQWKNGFMHGLGRSFWDEQSNTWKKNMFPGSPIRQHELDEKNPVSRPFLYVGMYVHDTKCDKQAVVTLKDGTTRMGSWRDGKPVGDWWTEHKLVAEGQRPSATIAVPPNEEGSSSAQQQEEEAKFPSLVVGRKNKRKIPDASSLSSSSPEATRPRRTTAQASAYTNRNPTTISPETKTAVVGPYRSHGAPESQSYGVQWDGSSDSEEVEMITVRTIDKSTSQRAADNVDVDAEEQRHIQAIQEWLITDGIGSNPVRKQMEFYARKLIELGFDSVEMIQKYFTKEDLAHLDSFMKPIHKRVFQANLTKNRQPKVG